MRSGSPPARARRSSWVKQPFVPAATPTGEQPPLVQPVGTVGPELHAVGDQAVATPVRRAGDVPSLEVRLHVLEALLERLAAVERARLVAGPGAELRIAT